MKKGTFLRVIWIVSGVLLLIAGILCFISPSVALQSIALWLGLFMLVSGVLDIIAFAKSYDVVIGSGWLLANGILTLLLGLLMLGNEWITATVLPLLLILWLISSGISSLVHSFDLKRFGVSGWGLMTAWGAVEIVFGVVSLFKPVAAVVAMAILIGITFVIEGIKMLITAFYTGRFLR
ncbi:MAG: hypothetical protein DBY25_03755 [Clostridiales bacterium]|nr:MAG: hypothetical protein DBY25_03755 [Clostridiales bacterium]